jgi:hypothetical protein
MPLQNRATPFGDIVAIEQRGLYTGNRGIIHDPATKTLLKKRWAAKAWLICVCEYKGRRREVMGGPPEVATIECTSILETAADKFVALTRRAGAELAGLVAEPDSTLVRHLHDLHALREHYDPGAVAALAREIMLADATAYGNKFPAYREDPLRETLRAVEGLAADPGYARQYDEFQRSMVYGNRAACAECIATLQGLAGRLPP